MLLHYVVFAYLDYYLILIRNNARHNESLKGKTRFAVKRYKGGGGFQLQVSQLVTRFPNTW